MAFIGVLDATQTWLKGASFATQADRAAFLSVQQTLGGFLGALIVFVADLAYYSNRTSQLWAYLLSSAFTGTLFALGAMFVHLANTSTSS